MSYRSEILKLLKNAEKVLTCTDICRELKNINIGTEYLSMSVSTKLAKLYHEGIIERIPNFGSKGGYGYKITEKGKNW